MEFTFKEGINHFVENNPINEVELNEFILKEYRKRFKHINLNYEHLTKHILSKKNIEKSFLHYELYKSPESVKMLINMTDRLDIFKDIFTKWFEFENGYYIKENPDYKYTYYIHNGVDNIYQLIIKRIKDCISLKKYDILEYLTGVLPPEQKEKYKDKLIWEVIESMDLTILNHYIEEYHANNNLANHRYTLIKNAILSKRYDIIKWVIHHYGPPDITNKYILDKVDSDSNLKKILQM